MRAPKLPARVQQHLYLPLNATLAIYTSKLKAMHFLLHSLFTRCIDYIYTANCDATVSPPYVLRDC